MMPIQSDNNAPSGTVPAAACTLVIFGAGGDLTKRLLMPALYNLSGSKLLPDDFSILGLDRNQQNTDQWRDALTDTMQSFTKDKTAEFYTPKLDDAAWGWVTGKDEITSRRTSISRTLTSNWPRSSATAAASCFISRWRRGFSA